VASPRSANFDRVVRAVDQALRQGGVDVVPLLLEEYDEESPLFPLLKMRRHLDFSRDPGRARQDLLAALGVV
jgi:hypothetical protein